MWRAQRPSTGAVYRHAACSGRLACGASISPLVGEMAGRPEGGDPCRHASIQEGYLPRARRKIR
ncbi:hypothetical protein EPK84_01300 (plasmid) [Sinorhizobium fredii]|nr:hypothetical protein EPK84_01300 [Sinorhizobium fredii]